MIYMTQGINFRHHVSHQSSRPPQPPKKAPLQTYLDNVKTLKAKTIPKGITIFDPSLSDEKKKALHNSYHRNLTCFENTMTVIDKTSQKIDEYAEKYRNTKDRHLKEVYGESIRFHIWNGNQQITLATQSRKMMKLLRNVDEVHHHPLYVQQADELLKLAREIETNPQNTQAPKRPARPTRSVRPQRQPHPIQPSNQAAKPNIIFRAMHKVSKRISALFHRS